MPARDRRLLLTGRLMQLALHERWSIVLLGIEPIVSSTREPQVVDGCLTTPRKRDVVMVDLQETTGRATSPVGTHERALPGIARMDLAQDLSGDIARSPLTVVLGTVARTPL